MIHKAKKSHGTKTKGQIALLDVVTDSIVLKLCLIYIIFDEKSNLKMVISIVDGCICGLLMSPACVAVATAVG